MILSLCRCLHCGETLSPINYGAVCRDYPECVALKGMFPRGSKPEASADLAGGDSSRIDGDNPSVSLPGNESPKGGV